MRFAIGSVLAVFVIAALFANAVAQSPAPWSAPHEQFSKADERLLEETLPGGRYLSRHTYMRCEKDGKTVQYHADGRITFTGVPCWDWRRWVSRE